MRDMTQGSAVRHVVTFAIPMVLGSIFQQLYNAADSVIVGQYVGPDALAAVGTSFPAMFLIISAVMGLTIGIQVIVSQLYGAGEHEELKRTFSTSLITLIGMVLVASVVGYYATEPLLRLINTPEAILPDAAAYMRIMFIGLIFQFMYNLYTSMLRGIGDSKTPLYFLIFSSILNVGLDLYFILVLKMGVSGAAIATIIAQGVAAALCILYTYYKVPLLRLTRADICFDKEIFVRILRFGIPTAIQQSVISLGMMAVVGLVNSFGTVTMAAYTAGNKVESFVAMPIMNIGNALSTFVGQNTGAGKSDRVRTGYRAVLKISIAISLAMSLLIIPFSKYLIMIFIRASEAEVIAIGAEYLSTMFLFYTLQAVMFCMGGFFRGVGDMKTALIISLLALAGRVTSAYLMAQVSFIGYRAIWLSMPVGWIIASLFGLYVYKSNRWTRFAVVKKPSPDDEPEIILDTNF